MQVGYIGLGNMGAGLARRLQLSQSLHLFDSNPATVAAVAAGGSQCCPDIKTLARACDIVFLCLPTSSEVRSVIFGEEGIAAHTRRGTLIIDQTSGNPDETRMMAADLVSRGIELIDAPVSGGPRRAEAGDISIMVGASQEQFQRALPHLSALSSNIFHAGEIGAGHVAKVVNNLIMAAQQVLTLEGIALAAKNGIAPDAMCRILTAGTARNYYLENLMQTHILTGRLAYTGSLGTVLKDLQQASQLADHSAVPLPMGNAAKGVFQQAANEMGQGETVNAIALVIERMAKAQIVPAGHDLSGRNDTFTKDKER